MRDRSFLLLISLLISLVLLLSVSSYEQVYDCRADYDIDARLDTLERAVVGTETVKWHNNTFSATSDIYIHLYLNAFSNDSATFIRESGLKLSEESRGWIRILSILDLQSNREISRGLRFVHPDDGNVFDSTVAILSLDRAVKSKDSISFRIQFYAKLPRAISRTGWAPGTQFYMIAQWFPKIGVFQNGTWNCHQVHDLTEPFSDFGTYNVRVTVPTGFVVGATGQASGEEVNVDGTVTHIFNANGIQDFAWVASSALIVKEHNFSYPGIPRVVVRLLLQPDHSTLGNRYFSAIDTAIKYFGIWYGPYPYGTITLVDIPRTASLGEAEYPALIVASANDYSVKNDFSLENVIIHQYGHQYWHEMVANDGFEYPWLDEGINSFCADKLVRKIYGPFVSVYKIADVYPVRLFPFLEFAGFPLAALIGDVWIPQQYNGLSDYLENVKTDAISEWGFHAFVQKSYHVMAYNKPELVLNTLEGLIGEKVMTRILRNYFEIFQYKHPTPAEFENVCEHVSGRRLVWLFNELIEGTGTVDYAISSIDYFRETDLSTNITSYEVKVLVMKNGSVTIPIDVRLKLEDGSIIDTTWSGEKRWGVLKFVVHSVPKFAQVDPFNKIPIDICYSNNSYVINSDMRGIVYWVNQIVSYVQNFLFTFLALI
jgi:hypothetical protein